MRNHKIYLASKSPRRRELLSGMGFVFDVLPTNVKEVTTEHEPVKVAEDLSRVKLSAINFDDFEENSLFIACDTIVVSGNEILGKPKNEEDARRMLRALSGKEHTVISGITVRTRKYERTDSRSTIVKFRELSDDEISHYIEQYRPLDKAGAYGIQEWIGYVGIESINGSFYNVMGLPTQLLWQMLKEAGIQTI